MCNGEQVGEGNVCNAYLQCASKVFTLKKRPFPVTRLTRSSQSLLMSLEKSERNGIHEKKKPKAD